MILADLVPFNDIVIQCHDNPDADALASGFAVKLYLEAMGRNARFIYRGPHKIQKSNLLIMIDKLEIDVSYEPDFDHVPELLILVDCQYGQRNVTTTEAKNIAVIDHHQICTKLPPLSIVRPELGSCSTILWNLIESEGLECDDDPRLTTALYYGLYTDTSKLSEISHPLDRDMMDDLAYNKSLIAYMSNCNYSLEEFEITGRAILNGEYDEEHKLMIVQSEPCDPNILGVISDFTLETDKIDICIAYYVSDREIKFSVRSCSVGTNANELAAFIADGIGGGGGHIRKAGGSIVPDLIDKPAKEVIYERLSQYFSKYQVLHAKETVLDMTGMKQYKKLEQILGTVKLTELFDVGTAVEIRTMEGDINIIVKPDTYIMIGVEGEIYPITEEKLKKSYNQMPFKYSREYAYEPVVKNLKTGEKKQVLPFAKSCTSIGSSSIYARPLTNSVKLFTAWDDERYYKGEPGDYIAVRPDDEHDIYIISNKVFDKLYKEA